MIHTLLPKVRGQAFHLNFQLNETHKAHGLDAEMERGGVAGLTEMRSPLPQRNASLRAQY